MRHKFKLLFIILLFFYPREDGIGQSIETIQQPPQQQSIDQLKAEDAELRQQLKEAVLKPKKRPVRIVTHTERIKPKTITVYVRMIDGSITEHKVTADGGFYILKESDLEIKPDTVIVIQTDTTRHKNFFNRILNR